VDWSPSELERRRRVERGEAVVANQRGRVDARLIDWARMTGRLVLICRGRRSPWENPFEIGRDGTREACIAAFIARFETRPGLQARLPELKGRVLACWCHPKRCHGDFLAEQANLAPMATMDTGWAP
jgi:hypothetical protein